MLINFRRSIIIVELWRLEVAKLQKFSFLTYLAKHVPLRGIFQNSVPISFIAAPIDVLCSNFVKFGRRKIGKIVRCLPDKKRKFAQLSTSRYCSDRAQNVPGPAQENALEVLQISPKSAHFGRVIPERVNTIRTGRKVYLIFGGSIALNRITKRESYTKHSE